VLVIRSLPRSYLKLILRKPVLGVGSIPPLKLIQRLRVPAISHFGPAVYHLDELPVIDRTRLQRHTLQCRICVAHDGFAKIVEAMARYRQGLCLLQRVLYLRPVSVIAPVCADIDAFLRLLHYETHLRETMHLMEP
jgi:hypothetical protein